MRILTMIPLQSELDPFLQGCHTRGWPSTPAQIGRLGVYRLNAGRLTVALGGLGKTQFGVQTQHLIDHGLPFDLVICAGAAGALDDALSVGDVVIGQETVEFDIQNRFGAPMLPRFVGAPVVLECLSHLPLNRAFNRHIGAIASGDEDVVDAVRRVEIRQQTGALVTAWEGSGAARACAFSHTPFIEVRGVSDGAGESAPQDFVANLPLTMAHVADVIVDLTNWL